LHNSIDNQYVIELLDIYHHLWHKLLMTENMILKVAIPTPMHKSFDYLIPADLQGANFQPGMRVQVPFGRQTLVGVILEIANHSAVASSKLKPIIKVLDEKPLWQANLFELIKWTSDYYHHPIGETFAAAMPKLLRNGAVARLRSMSYAVASPSLRNPILESPPFSLNEHQQQTLATIDAHHGFKVFLLDGVTGSGKTEVYLNKISKVITNDQQALVLVPEIALTPQTVKRFQERFGEDTVVVWHSQLTDRERLQTWLMAKENLAKVIIGTRSAIFIPCANLGVIIVDEEHDSSFKQQSNLRYSARDIAIMRAKSEDMPVILGSATPSLESIFNAERGVYCHLHLPNRAGSAVLPTFKIIDLRCEEVTDGLSATLIAAMKNQLTLGNQVLVFLNRRGYAPVLLCKQCGWVANCNRCDAKMTLHNKPAYLQCHHCGVTRSVYQSCPTCNGKELINLGLGTERVEECLVKLFPTIDIVRIDRDTTRKKDSLVTLIDKINNNQSQILLGTQMLAKGHHFSKVAMVAIISADQNLLGIDFRATEKFAQLLMQVSGRAGREDIPGEVYIQTYNPENPLLVKLVNSGYQEFVTQVLQERKIATLPPFAYFGLLKAEAKDQQLVFDFLNECKQKISAVNFADVEILGPVAAQMQKKANYYRAQLLLSSKKRKQFHELLNNLVNELSQLKMSNGLRWFVDIDPIEVI
jgi:primosomal protein N' (replication factor Y)